MRINKTLWLLPVLALIVMGAVLPGSKIKDYPHATDINDNQWYVVSEDGITESINGGVLRTNLSTNAYVSAVTTSNSLVTRINATNTALIATLNLTSNAVYQAGTNTAGILASNNVRVAAGVNTTVGTNNSGGVMVYTVGSSLDTNVIGTNVAGILASNNVRVAAGANVTVTPTASGGVLTYTVASASSLNAISANFDSITITNAVNRIRSLVPSTTLITQIDFSTGPTAYYWTNMVTNITLQITNVWVGSVSNRVLDFFFTGATNTGPNYTVTFSCPTPSGLIFRWGMYSATNGATAFNVTNNQGAGVSLTLWDTNLIEAYYSPTR